jgi:UDP-N-acetylmuramate: L-alanyl-gamma-D-glutamyl-meso-diaminopimelate ligase
LISGVAWDINVFQLIKYVEQFEIFLLADWLMEGFWYTTKAILKLKLVLPKLLTNPIRKLPCSTPNYKVENGTTLLHPEGDMPIEVLARS